MPYTVYTSNKTNISLAFKYSFLSKCYDERLKKAKWKAWDIYITEQVKKPQKTQLFCKLIYQVGNIWVSSFLWSHVISVYNHESCEFEYSLCQGVLYTALWDKVSRWLAVFW